jgi:hypothetical protein
MAALRLNIFDHLRGGVSSDLAALLETMIP